MPGKTALAHFDQAEEVSLEHGPEFRVLAFLDCGHVAEAGVVHQDIDFAESCFGLLTASMTCAESVRPA